jgi:hypothetical protein
MAQPSPYTPGEVARQVPGRGAQLTDMDERLSYMVDLRRLIGRVRVDTAPRGLGKTSLLREAQRHAEGRGALTVWVTAGEELGLVSAIGEEIQRATENWAGETRSRLRQLVEHLQLTLGVPGVASVKASWPAEPGGAPARGVREFQRLITETVRGALDEDRTGLVLFIDEIQAADPDGLRTLAYTWQHMQSEAADVPAAVFAAGLPNAPESIAAVVTFSERFAYRRLEPLPDEAVHIALASPAGQLGVRWDDDALDEATSIAQGYPYSVQLIADSTWAAAGYPDRGASLTLDHVHEGRRRMKEDLNALFRSRWEKCAPSEQQLMQAMAAHGDGPVRRADVAQYLGVPSGDLSVPRARLIDKGIIDIVSRGQLQFTIPGFAAYVRGRTENPLAKPVAPLLANPLAPLSGQLRPEWSPIADHSARN